jgi:hypothetical protein
MRGETVEIFTSHLINNICDLVIWRSVNFFFNQNQNGGAARYLGKPEHSSCKRIYGYHQLSKSRLLLGIIAGIPTTFCEWKSSRVVTESV